VTEAPWAAPRPEPRHRLLQVFSIALIIFGFLGVLVAIALADPPEPLPIAIDRSALIFVLVTSAALLVGGLVMNAIRALLARRRLPADRYRGPSIWIMLLFAVAVATLASIVFAEDAVALATGEGPVSLAGSLVLLTAIQASLLVLTAVFVIWPRALAGARWIDRQSPGRGLRIGLGLAIPAWLAASLLAVLVALGLRQIGLDPETGVVQQALEVINPVVAVLTVVIIGPIAEEVFFRGVVFNAWLREYGYRQALVGSGLLFGLVHMSMVGFVPFVLLGILLAVVYRRTGSLMAPIALHVAFNAISVGLALLAQYGVIGLPT
jgi:uncharacterized protein